MKRVRIGLLGCGTVGGGFVQLVEREGARIRARHGVELSITRILVRDAAKERAIADRALLTTAATDVIDDDTCDVVVETVGGVHAAAAFVRRALARRRHVVTANKALLATAGGELFAAAARSGVAIGFEASVCGGVPVVGALRRGLAGDSIESIRGILNGTSNYVLTRMEAGLSLAEALACAQERGFAEADPSLDLSGEDAAQKLRILAELAFDAPPRRTRVDGIASITVADVEHARRNGRVLRQVAEATRVHGGVELTVETRALPANDPLARVVDEQNAVVIRGRAVGEICLSGRGAGSMPTAAAVLADVLEIAAA
ncbi:MAG: homoserine dehydrogenase [Acidobacteria bacterium]|nr:homoserine dehydrogenase [Acidobacteriota bacterium]MBV9474590.1 homoserine dehydrogenase [Acidobacteriota bacterium]